jgi:hypothetical protein
MGRKDLSPPPSIDYPEVIMERRTSWLAPGKLAVVLLVLAIPLGLSVRSASAVDVNNESISGMANQIVGMATSSSGGVAVPGPAIAVNVPVVVQGNVQVDTTGNPNNVQNATNDAMVGQNTTAASGNPTATNSGVATSGASVAVSMAVVTQMNIQVITGGTPAGGVTQNATNDAGVGQDTATASGNTNASGGGSTATSGAAMATTSAMVTQVNTQMYIGSMGIDTTGSVQQDLQNSAGVGQANGAATGATSAMGSSTATSGSAQSLVNTIIQQTGAQTVNE